MLTLHQQEIKDAIQQAANGVSSVIESVRSKNQEVAHELAHQTYKLSHHLSSSIHHLRREAHHLGDEAVQITAIQVSNKLSEIRASLDQAANFQGKSNAQAWINELKYRLKTNIHKIAVQFDRLAQLLRTGRETSRDALVIDNLIMCILSNSLSEAQRPQWRLENIYENTGTVKWNEDNQLDINIQNKENKNFVHTTLLLFGVISIFTIFAGVFFYIKTKKIKVVHDIKFTKYNYVNELHM